MQNRSTTCMYQLYWERYPIIFEMVKWYQPYFLTYQKKVMVITAPQMSKHHQLKEEKINVKCNSIILERVLEWKLLGITLDEHLQLDKHISKLLKYCYSSRSVLKKLEQYTSWPVWKQLTESLVFSRQDYCNNLQKQSFRDVLERRCPAKQLYWNRTPAWVFSCKFAAYF